jgi:DNA-binding transcriptional regulator YhcF (GntR family)
VAPRDQQAWIGGAPGAVNGAQTTAFSEIRRLLPVQPRTMVEQAAEAIVAAAARGAFLPGDRLVEAEIARDLGISRVPVREALRLLESQGIVNSTPYKGMRLMEVTNAGVAALMRVRLALETQAIGEALAQPGVGRPGFKRLGQAAEDYLLAAKTATRRTSCWRTAYSTESCAAPPGTRRCWRSGRAFRANSPWCGASAGKAVTRRPPGASTRAGPGAPGRRPHGAAGRPVRPHGWHQGFDFEAVLMSAGAPPWG